MSEEMKEKEAPKEQEPQEEKPKKGHSFGMIGCMVFVAILLILAVAFYFMFYWSFSDGVKSGNLNYLTKKGYVFKTYEGRLIQDGLKSGVGTAGVQSNEFIFSVANEDVAKQLEALTGQNVQLHYSEYNHALWWRGNSEFVVDSITSVGTSFNYNVPSQINNNVASSSNESLQNQVIQLQQQVIQLQQELNALKQSQGGSSNNSGNGSQRVYKSPNSND